MESLYKRKKVKKKLFYLLQNIYKLYILYTKRKTKNKEVDK